MKRRRIHLDLVPHPDGEHKKRRTSLDGDAEEYRPWEDLLEELVENVMRNLLFSEQACVRAVCKKWNALRHVRPIRGIPWLLHWHTNSLTTCKLYNPYKKRIHLISDTGFKDKAVQHTGCSLWDTKNGWLLMSQSFVDSDVQVTSFFLYNPFNNERFEFPELKGKGSYRHISVSQCATFSTAPTSPNCIVFIMKFMPLKDKIVINTCHPGDGAWTKTRISSSLFPASNVIYRNDKFYCFQTSGKLGVFNVNERIWSVFDVNVEALNQASMYHKVLVESDGDLLVIPKTFSSETVLYKLDLSRMRCTTIESIGNRVVFAGPAIIVSGSESRQGIEDRVYYFENDRPKFHSLKYHRSLPATSTYGGINTEGCNLDSLFCAKWCRKPACSDHCSMTWIEPPL